MSQNCHLQLSNITKMLLNIFIRQHSRKWQGRSKGSVTGHSMSEACHAPQDIDTKQHVSCTA